MFHSVLVPIDFTDKNDAAVEIAARLVDDDGLITLIHVVQTVPGIDAEEERDFYERLESAAEEKLAALGRRLDDEGVAWRAILVVGSRGGEILAAAEDGIDLIVVSSHRVDSRHPGAGVGTLSYQLAIAAACPVLLVK